MRLDAERRIVCQCDGLGEEFQPLAGLEASRRTTICLAIGDPGQHIDDALIQHKTIAVDGIKS